MTSTIMPDEAAQRPTCARWFENGASPLENRCDRARSLFVDCSCMTWSRYLVRTVGRRNRLRRDNCAVRAGNDSLSFMLDELRGNDIVASESSVVQK